VGGIWCHNNVSQGPQRPMNDVDTAKCPRLRCRSREQAAIMLRSCLRVAVRETNKSCGCYVICVFGCKDNGNLSRIQNVLQIIYGLIFFSSLKWFVVVRTTLTSSHISFRSSHIRPSFAARPECGDPGGRIGECSC